MCRTQSEFPAYARLFFRCGTCGGGGGVGVKAMGAYRPRAIFFSALSLSALGSHGTGDFSRGTGRGNEVGISVTAFHHHHRLRYAAGILLGNADRTSACVNTFFDLIFSLIANRCRQISGIRRSLLSGLSFFEQVFLHLEIRRR